MMGEPLDATVHLGGPTADDIAKFGPNVGERPAHRFSIEDEVLLLAARAAKELMAQALFDPRTEAKAAAFAVVDAYLAARERLREPPLTVAELAAAKHLTFSVSHAPGDLTFEICSMQGGGRVELPVAHVAALRAVLAPLARQDA